MIGRILKGYLGLLASLARIAALASACVAAALVVVYPLWRLATGNPDAYTLVCGILFALIAVFLAVSRMRTAHRLDPARFRRSLLKFSILAVGLPLFVILVLSWHRLAAFALLLLTAAAWGAAAFLPHGEHRPAVKPEGL